MFSLHVCIPSAHTVHKDPVELKLQMAIRCHVEVENQALVLQKSSKCTFISAGLTLLFFIGGSICKPKLVLKS